MLNQLIATHGPPTCTLPIPEMSAKTPWDRDVLAGRKTVEGRVLRWRRRGKWTTNRKVEAIAPPGTWFPNAQNWGSNTQNKHEERNSAARHGFLSRKQSYNTPFLGSRLSLGAQEAMSPGLVAVELANIVQTPF